MKRLIHALPKGREVSAAFVLLLLLASTAAMWFSFFPVAGQRIDPRDVFFESAYFCISLGTLFLVRKTKLGILSAGWTVFTFGLFIDLLDEFTLDPDVINIQLEGTITSLGLLCIGVGAYAGALRFRREIAEREEAERKLADSERKYRLVSENVSDVVFIQDMELQVRYVSPSVETLSGYTPEEVYRMEMRDYMTRESWLRASEDFRKYAALAVRGELKETPLMEYEYVCKDGSTFWGELKVRFLFDDSGRPTMHQGIVRDITERKRAEEALKRERDHLENVLENSADGIAIVDRKGWVRTWNKRAREMLGYGAEELRERRVFDFYADKAELERMLQKLRADGYVRDYEIGLCRRDGTVMPGAVSIRLLQDERGEGVGSVAVIRDLTERKSMEERLRRLSLQDSLTGLCNRACFEQEMRRLEELGRTPIALIVCDLDGLKLINDSLGHGTGDALIKQTASILRQCFRQDDIIARIGGDEFAVLLPESDAEAARATRERVNESFQLYNAKSPRVPLSVSIGYAVCAGSRISLADLYKEADNNMYREKVLRSRSARSHMVQALLKTLEARDYLTEGHGDRMQRLAAGMGRKLGLQESRVNDLRLLAQFHDLGKIGIPDSILFKPGPLSEEEYGKMQEHCEIGYRIALSAPQLTPIAEFILKHHEWWDGRGYPLGLQGTDIPLECRILAVVDAFDTITSERPYKGAKTRAEAVQELKRCAGTQFDPDLVDQFLDLLQGMENDERTEEKACGDGSTNAEPPQASMP
jgi:diguanylate cyclase (GGDEF)-like protein/PAS domain S-box-containing protein